MSELNFIDDILSKSIISLKEIFSDVIFVDSNPAKIDFTSIRKTGDKIERISQSETYHLKSINLKLDKLTDYGLIYAVCLSLDKEFIKSITQNFCLDEAEYYPPLLLRPFVKGNPDKIVSEFSGCDWVITSKKVLNKLKKHKRFQEIENDTPSSIKLKGRIDNVHIFITEDLEKDIIWKGNRGNCGVVMVSDILIEKQDNIYDIKVEYLFNCKGIRKLSLV